MYFNSIAEIVAATNELTVKGNRTQYPVLFKKAVCDYIVRKGTKPSRITSKVHMTAALMNKWLVQYNDGLYTMEGAYCVSKKSLSTNAKILKQLNTEANLLQRKIDLVKQCEALGITVTSGV